MSKQNTRNSRSLLRSVASVVIVGGCMSLFADSSIAQDKGFSIFEPAKTSSDAPVVAPKEAFTNPIAKLPKSQFGSFGSSNTTTVSSKPQLNGSKPEGTYAQDGRSMFRQPPTVQSNSLVNERLKPFSPNSLRSDNRPQPDNEIKIQSKPAPIVVGDFQQSARPLSPSSSNPAKAQPAQPKVAQVAFQDGSFTPIGRTQVDQRGNAGNRFSQSTPNRFSQSPPSTSDRFSRSTSQPPQSNRSQLAPRQTTLGQTGTQPVQRRQPAGSFPPAAQQQARPSAQSGFSNLRMEQNARSPQPRVAALPQSGQPVNRRANQNQNSVAPKTNKAGSQAAKELLGKWAQANPELELPGKRMKLHEFLAQPINGSRKDAINQYWVTFGDMANHKLAIEQSQWLSSIANPRQQTDQAVLKAAQQDAQNRVLHTEIQLAKSQSILGDFLPNLRYKNGKSIPVLPSDIPWVGKLNTNLAKYQARGIVPTRFNAIDDILPKARQLIANRADAVKSASLAAQQAKTALANGQSPVANVLEAVRMKSKNQQDFLSNVTGYNRAITDYVLSVRQDINQPKRLASVLIGRKSVQTSVAQSERREKPEEDVDSLLNESNPTMRQVSTGQRAQSQQPQGLVGRSAYQNQGNMNQGNASALQASSNSMSPANTPQPADRAKSSFAYGPTKESAAAANFDPAKIKEELPMQQAKTKGTSPGYNQSTAGSDGRRGQSASQRNASQPLGGANRRTAPQNNPVGQTGNQPPRGRFNPSSTTGGFGSQSSGSPQSQRTTFPPQPDGAAAEKTPSIPGTPVSNPFSSMNAKPDPTAGASTTGRRQSSLGGGGFPGGAQQPGSTASRFGSGSGDGGSGFGSTRR